MEGEEELNHEYSTYTLVLISMILGGAIIGNALLSEDVDELCSTNNSLLKRDGTWGCVQTSWAYGYYHNYYSPIQVHFTAANTYANITVYNNVTGLGFTVLGNSVLVQHTGQYMVQSSISFNGGNGGDYEYELFVNDVAQTQCAFFLTTSTVDVRNGGFTCLLDLTAGDKLILKAKDISAPTQDMWYYQLSINIVEIQ